jgi:hypothetical protein
MSVTPPRGVPAVTPRSASRPGEVVALFDAVLSGAVQPTDEQSRRLGLLMDEIGVRARDWPTVGDLLGRSQGVTDRRTW